MVAFMDFCSFWTYSLSNYIKKAENQCEVKPEKGHDGRFSTVVIHRIMSPSKIK